jgi:hypothetical protein
VSCRASLDGVALPCCHANGSGAARISMWKSLSDVTDCAAPMHMARQRVLAAPRTLARPKVLDLKIKKHVELKFVFKKS